jgi:hypothetical protein
LAITARRAPISSPPGNDADGRPGAGQDPLHLDARAHVPAVVGDQPFERLHEAACPALDDGQPDRVEGAGDRQHLKAAARGVGREAGVQRPRRVQLGDLVPLEARLEPRPRGGGELGREREPLPAPERPSEPP